MISLIPDSVGKVFPRSSWEEVIPLFEELYQNQGLAEKSIHEKIAFLASEVWGKGWVSDFGPIGTDELGNISEAGEPVSPSVALIIMEKAYAQMMSWVVLTAEM